MITIFNRKKLLVTFDIREQNRVREALCAKGIDYIVSTIDRMSPSPFGAGSRARVGTLGQDQNAQVEYLIYVKKIDYEAALHAIK